MKCGKCGNVMDKGKLILEELLESKRLRVLLDILKFQKENGRGITFPELVEMSTISRATVSKCQDSLNDVGLLNDDWATVDGKHTKVIFIPDVSVPFVEKIEKDIGR